MILRFSRQTLIVASACLLAAGSLSCTSAPAPVERPEWPVIGTMQFTGTVVAVTDRTIVVAKGVERWEFLRDQWFTSYGDLKVGIRASITFRPLAFRAVVKPAAEGQPGSPE